MFVLMKKSHPKNFVFLILGIFELFNRKLCEMFACEKKQAMEHVKK